MGRELSFKIKVRKWEKGDDREGDRVPIFYNCSALNNCQWAHMPVCLIKSSHILSLRTPVKLDETSETQSIVFFRNSLQNPLWQDPHPPSVLPSQKPPGPLMVTQILQIRSPRVTVGSYFLTKAAPVVRDSTEGLLVPQSRAC